jgi:hypothetical protein
VTPAEACSVKQVYLTQRLANNAADRLGLRYPDAPPLRAYDCPCCPDWHLRTVDEPASPPGRKCQVPGS